MGLLKCTHLASLFSDCHLKIKVKLKLMRRPTSTL